MIQRNIMEPQTLKQIVQWSKNKGVVISPIQRGLVWKPSQVELLWDSILRKFPIGSFMLLEEANEKHSLVDGQQRYNAIEKGFEFDEKNSRAELWIDLCPQNIEGTTRKFWIKSTTISHPWGYQNDDECSFLTAEEKREAMISFGFEGKNIYKDEILLSDTWPIKSKYPFPLSFILKLGYECTTKESFDKCFKQKVEEFKKKHQRWACFVKENYPNSDHLEQLYKAANNLYDYKIPLNIIQHNTLKDESDNTSNGKNNLEVLFNRINTGGTKISQAELCYSAIKAYWPNIKELNDKLAQELMPAEDMAMLSFRLAYTIFNNNNELVVPLSIKQIRRLHEDPKMINIIHELYDEGKLEKIVRIIESWLTENTDWGMPKVLRTEIAIKYPDIYLLLMCFVNRSIDREPIEVSDKYFAALALYLKWFSFNKDEVASSCKEIFKSVKNKISEVNINATLYELIRQEKIIALYAPNDTKSFIDEDKLRNKLWNAEKLGEKPWIYFFNKISSEKEMILYAERSYLKEEFPRYDPSKKDLFEEQNRPWDYDHIIPRSWIYNRKSGDWREFCNKWLPTNGNFAAIPFEVNRSKSNNDDWDYYKQHEKSLLYKEDVSSIQENEIRTNEDTAMKFASITLHRTLNIYEHCYDSLFSSLYTTEDFSKGGCCHKRKSLFESVKNELSSNNIVSRVYCLEHSWQHLENEVTNHQYGWTAPWISLNIEIDNQASVSLTSNDGKILEIGIRKAPNTLATTQDWKHVKDIRNRDGYINDDNAFWYLCEEFENKTAKEIADKMENLNEIFQK